MTSGKQRRQSSSSPTGDALVSVIRFACTPSLSDVKEATIEDALGTDGAVLPRMSSHNWDELSDVGEEDRHALEALNLELKTELLDAASQQKLHPPQRGRPPKPPPPIKEPENDGPPPVIDSLLGHGSGLPLAMMPMPPPQLIPTIPMMMPNPHVPVVAAATAMQHAARLRDLFASGQATAPMPPCPWFDPSGICQEEVDELRISFPNLKRGTPVEEADRESLAYVTLRNTLIDIYRACPNQKLTLAECRKHCDGDLAALIRVMSFLERNRLVNFALAPQLYGGSPHALQNTRLKEELRNHWSKTPTCTACDRICLYSFYILSPAVYGGSLPLPQLKPALWCADCAREAPYNQCLSKVCLPALNVSGGASSWSEAQINVLFDAIEGQGPDWISVSKMVSTVPGNPVRSPRECLAAFLAMPLAEPSSVTHNDLLAPAPRKSMNIAKDPQAASTGLKVLITALELLTAEQNNQSTAETKTMARISRICEGQLKRVESQQQQLEGHLPLRRASSEALYGMPRVETHVMNDPAADEDRELLMADSADTLFDLPAGPAFPNEPTNQQVSSNEQFYDMMAEVTPQGPPSDYHSHK